MRYPPQLLFRVLQVCLLRFSVVSARLRIDLRPSGMCMRGECHSEVSLVFISHFLAILDLQKGSTPNSLDTRTLGCHYSRSSTSPALDLTLPAWGFPITVSALVLGSHGVRTYSARPFGIC